MGSGMKTPDKIKNGLEHCCEAGCKHCPYKDDCHLSDGGSELAADALAYIQQLEAQVPKWISVEERMPEDGVNVLVYAIGCNEPSVIAMSNHIHSMYGYNIEGWRAPWQYFFHEYKITHWMPLPEPPKEG